MYEIRPRGLSRALAPVLPLLLGLSLLAAGCGKGTKAGGEASSATTATPAAAVAEDMCAEHGVLEAICTKCHPKLIPVFQAKGDWCAEHGFPMSVCPVHHPERGGRPAVEVSIDEAPATGTMVKFRSLEIARDAGIETAPAVEGTAGAGIVATATLVADASHVAVVNPRAAGVVREIRADLGSRVKRGTPLVVLESSVVAEERSKLRAARARAAVAEANHRREKELYEKGVSALREVQEAEREWEAAKGEVAAATAALDMFGAADGDAGSYVLAAPIAGVVTKRTATVGTLVDLDDALFEIVDTASLWADIDVPEMLAPRVRPGQRVVLTVDGLPGREFHGTVDFVSPVIDPQTRTARARAAVPNQDGALRANMYARARILDPGAASVLVPRSAVQDARGVQIVFVQRALDAYETRRVRAVPAANDMVAIGSEVRPNELVVTTGSFLLKTETLKESIGAGCCEVEPPKRNP
jgi:membrane fusion protein, heavy metal efflux system